MTENFPLPIVCDGCGRKALNTHDLNQGWETYWGWGLSLDYCADCIATGSPAKKIAEIAKTTGRLEVKFFPERRGQLKTSAAEPHQRQ